MRRSANLSCMFLLLALWACKPEQATHSPSPKSAYPVTDKVTQAPAERPDKGLIVAHLGFLPDLLESPNKGSFIDLVKAIDEEYEEGKIEITVYPLKRAKLGIINGTADINLPALRHPNLDTTKLAYRFSSTPFGKVTHVLYSNINKPISAQMLLTETSLSRPLVIEAVSDFFPFPTHNSNQIQQSLEKLSRQRIDGFIWAQEEADQELKRLGLKNIHREYLGEFDDVFIVPNNPHGSRVDAILTAAITKLRESGKLKVLYEKIHRPFDPWQPYAHKAN